MNDYKIKELYEQMELELIASMKRNLKRHLNEENKVGFHFTQWQAEKLKELKRYQRENARIIGKRTRGLNKKVSEHLQKELKQGSLKAMKQYNKLHKDKFKADKLLNKSFFQTNDAKVNNLIKVVNNDLNIVKASALRMTNDQYREVIHKSAFFNANGVMTEKQAVDMANKDFLSRGLNCIEYKDGRRVNIASYSQMSVRTASLRAQLMGEGDFRKEIGNPLVIVTTHGGACKLCTAWQDKVLIDDVYSGGTKEDGDYPLLSEAMKQGFLHPNCRHGLATYYPELEGIKYDEEETDEEIDDALRDKLNYYDRQEQANIRKSKGFIDRDNVKSAKKEIMACEKKKDELILEYETPYEDVTQEFYKYATPKSNNVTHAKKFVTDDGREFIVNNETTGAYFDYDSQDYKDSKKCAQLLRKIFGGKIELQPVVNYEDSISTCDLKWTNPYSKTFERWDLKTIEGSKNTTLDSMIKKKKRQSHNFIFDLKNHTISKEDAQNQIIEIFNNKHRDWVETIMLKDEDEIIFIYKRK